MLKSERDIQLLFKAPNIACTLEQEYPQFESWHGWIVKLGLFSAGGLKILCVRERATGMNYKNIMKNVGIAYANHSIYYYLDDDEVKSLEELFKDFKENNPFRLRFQEFIEDITRKAQDPNNYGMGKIYGSTVYGPGNIELCHAITDPAWIQNDIYDKLWVLWKHTADKEIRKRDRALQKALKSR